MKRWITGWLLVASLAGCSSMPWAQSRSQIIPPPTAPTAVAAKPAPSAPATSRTDPFAGHTLTGEPEVVEGVALTVNNRVITVSEVFHPVRQNLLAAGQGATREEFLAKAGQIIRREIQLQIGQSLVVEEATEQWSEGQLAFIDSLVDERIRDQVLVMGGSRHRLIEQLEAEGVTLADAKTALRRQLTSQYYMHGKLSRHLDPTRPEMWRYYQSHRDEFTRPGKVKMQILAFPYSAFYGQGTMRPTAAQKRQAQETAKSRAAAGLERIRGGEDFGAVVRDVSVSEAYYSATGGVWGLMSPGSFRETAVEKAAFALAEGQVSDVIVGQNAAFVVKAIGVTPSSDGSFEQAQVQIKKVLRERKYDILAKAYDDELRSRAVIVQPKAFSEFAMQRAIQEYYQNSQGH